MKKNFNLSAFSLMEMMIVLLIVAIIAAASAPMIAKKMMRQTGTGDSPWNFTGVGSSIAFNSNRNNVDTVFIGADNIGVPFRRSNDGNPVVTEINNTPLYIRAPRMSPGRHDLPPFMTFADPNNRYLAHLGVSPNYSGSTGSAYFSNIIPGEKSTVFGNSIFESGGIRSGQLKNKIIFGHSIDIDASTPNSNETFDVAVGSDLNLFTLASEGIANVIMGHNIDRADGSNSRVQDTIMIGMNQRYCVNGNVDGGIAIGRAAAINGGNGIIAIGDHASVQNDGAIAIGRNSISNQSGAIAIGSNTVSSVGSNAIAIGGSAQASAEDAIAIGGGTSATGQRAIAIGAGNGNNVRAQGQDSIAIGTNAQATGNHSVAIGLDAQAAEDNRIVLGRASGNGVGHTVVIPGTLDVQGTVSDRTLTAMRNALGISDIRLKNVGEKFTSGLEDIKKLEFFNYTYKNDKEKKPHVGVMAQDLQKVFPISVTEGSDGYLRIRRDEMFYAALNAIKELDNRIVELKNKIVAYFNRVEQLEVQIDEQQKTIEELRAQNAEFKKRLVKLEKKKWVNKGVNKGGKSSNNKNTESEAE